MALTEIISCIQNNYRKSTFDINTVHCTIGQSSTHSRTLIKREYKCSIHDLLEIVRVAAALERLAEGIEIDLLYSEVGFVSCKTLRDAFHRRLDCPPSQCRVLLLEAKDTAREIERLRRIFCPNDSVYSFVENAVGPRRYKRAMR